jgi:hypothetical protein
MVGHFVVPVMLMVVAVRAVAPKPPLLAPTAMQSPTFTSDRDAVATVVNRVVLPKATLLVPLEVVTATPSVPTDATVPVTDDIR